MNKKRDMRNFVIGILCVTIVFMGIGFSALADRLEITGTAGIGDAKWQIEITNFSEKETVGATTNDIIKHSTIVNFDVDLEYPGAYAIYNVTIKNRGTIDAVLESTTIIEEADDVAEKILKFELVGFEDEMPLEAQETITGTVKVSWLVFPDENTVPDNDISKKADIMFNFVQNTN